MSDSGFQSSLPDESERRPVFERGGQAFIPSNEPSDNDVSSRRQAAPIEEQVRREGPSMGADESRMGVLQAPQAPPLVQFSLSDCYPAMPLQAVSSSVDPASDTHDTSKEPQQLVGSISAPLFSNPEQVPAFHHSESSPEISSTTDAAPAGPSASHNPVHSGDEWTGYTDSAVSDDSTVGDMSFDDSSTKTVVQQNQKRPPDADFKWRGIPEGDDEETTLKTVVNFHEGWNELNMPPVALAYTGCSVEDCTAPIIYLLDNTGTGANVETRRQKQQILIGLLPRSSPFPAKTIIGLAEVLLQLTHDEIQHLCSQHHQGDLHNTCVHAVLKEMNSEGLRLGHLVKYFCDRNSKRVDILKIVRDIHSDCPFCDGILQQL